MHIALLIALAVGTVSSTGTEREPLIRTPFERPVVLSGKSSSASTNIVVESNAGDSELNLVWSVSDLVDRENSLITVFVDQQPIRTSRLSSTPGRETQRWGISLGQLEPGPHQIMLKTHLEVAGDPCLIRFSKEAWLRIESATSIALPPRAEEESGSGLRNLPTVWQGSERLVQVVPPQNMSADSVLAVLEASAQLRVWGFAPTLETQPKRLVLVPLEEASTQDQLAEQLRSAPEHAQAIAGLEAQEVTLVAKSAVGLADAIRQLADESSRALCPKQGACLFSGSVPSNSDEDSDNGTANDAIVLDLRKLGYKHGFASEGSGTHVLRFVWQRPSTWKLTQPAELHLDMRLPETSLVDHETTTVSVRVNEQPVATWHVYDKGAPHDDRVAMKAKVPMDFATDDALSFEIIVRIGIKDGIACEAINDESVWLVLEGTSRLLVERNEKRYEGIAAFFRSTETQRPSLTATSMTNWQDVLWLAAILQPFVDQTRSQRWRWSEGQGEQPHIDIRSLEQQSSNGATWIKNPAGAWWLETASSKGLPLIAVTDSVRLSATSAGLEIRLGQLTSESPTPPAYTQLVDSDALWVKPTWVSLKGDTTTFEVHSVKGAEPSASESLARLKSHEERTLRTINLFWAGLAGLLFLGTILYWRRKPTTLATAGNIEEMNDKDSA